MTSRQAKSEYMRVAGQAVRKVRYAVKTGRLVRQPCETCGSTVKVQAHHGKGYDAEHELDVTWLCLNHHNEAHGKRTRSSWERPGQVRAYLRRTNRVCGHGEYVTISSWSSPRRVLIVLERMWGWLRTDEERAAVIALFDRLRDSEELTA